MLLSLRGDHVELENPFDFSRFSLAVRNGEMSLAGVRRAFDGIAFIADEKTAWVDEDALRRWSGLDADERWQAGLTRMVEYARKRGWHDESKGSIRAHIEWQSEHSAGTPACPADPIGQDFKRAMRRLAASVSIVTTRERGVPHGMTATAVTSLTADPPALVVCVNKSASLHRPLSAVRRFCVNLLAAHHAGLCAAFSGQMKGKERFVLGDWRTDGPEMPYLETAQASFFCHVDGQMTYGTHSVFIGRVEALRISGEGQALVHHDGRFVEILPVKS
jgi:flavin reductase (DIM6/NTAB) family NADH-FMN oxidoreductase RutF